MKESERDRQIQTVTEMGNKNKHLKLRRTGDEGGGVGEQ